MPGLLGIYGRTTAAAVGTDFDAMLAPMNRGGRLQAETCKDEQNRWALGRVHLGVFQPEPQLQRTGPIRALFHGELANGAELRADVINAGGPEPRDAASLIVDLYRRYGRQLASKLEGAFCAAILDEQDGSVTLISDRLGSYPLYWFAVADRFVFASELKAALRAHPKPALNPVAVADLLKFAFPMGDKTLAHGVDLVPSGATLTFCGRSGDVHLDRYDAIANFFRPDAASQADYMRRVQSASEQALDRAVAGTHRYGLSLSGGLDTRVILSGMDRRGQSEGTSTFTLGGRGCADEVIGYQLARMARTRHRFVALDDHYLDDLLPTTRHMALLTDGMYVSHGFTEMLALQGFEQSDCSVLLRGHVGELAKASTAWPFHTDRTIFEMQPGDRFVPYLLSRMTHVSRGDTARQVFSDSTLAQLDGASAARSLQETIDGVELAPADLCSYIYLKEYHRRVTVPSLDIFRNVAEVRVPFADADFLRAVLSGQARWRDGVGIHQALIAANKRSYLRVRNPNTGAPAGAGPMTEAVLDKVNTILRRLNVYGYRHYHSFDGWMRRALLELVDKVVLAPETLARGVFREAAVRRMVQEARGGSLDHDDLLQVLVNVELWQREVRIQ